MNKKEMSNDIYLIINRVSHAIRLLRNDMQSSNMDCAIKDLAGTMPDTRSNLQHVIELTELSAERVLLGIELAGQQQNLLNEESVSLTKLWEHCLVNENQKELAETTRCWLSQVPSSISLTRSQLVDIMLAQEYLDITGQLISHMSDVLCDIEKKLLSMIPEYHYREHEIIKNNRKHNED